MHFELLSLFITNYLIIADYRYNLSSYPFLSLVPDPEEIDFKCDGLHDGFYASIKYSCQVFKINYITMMVLFFVYCEANTCNH